VTVTFILPAIGKKKRRRYVRSWQLMEPLTIMTLAAATPSGIDARFFDDRIELIDYAVQTDLVAITTECYTARRAYAIAGRFRARGVPVVLGGYHATLCPEEAQSHADAVVVGNGERVWPQLLADFREGRLRRRYEGGPDPVDLVPDRAILGGKRYARLGVVETGRGCCFRCEFCAISAFYGGRYHRRPVAQVIRDIREAQKTGKRYFFFADDNIVADPAYARTLFEAIRPLGIRWTGQGSLNMARDPQLLSLMKRSGCVMILIGYESLDAANLVQMGKGWSTRTGEVESLTRRVHEAGISIYATFLFGFDADTPRLVERTVAFAKKAGFFLAAFNHLLPIPGTPLYRRLRGEEALTCDPWWLSAEYRYGQLAFRPKSMSASETSEACRRARVAFYRLPSMLRRAMLALWRSRSLVLFAYFWYVNLHLGWEVAEKMGLPLGENLDELPK
jgi:radical SAM superfamily enzyme YgiQ (UPF0313 family)